MSENQEVDAQEVPPSIGARVLNPRTLLTTMAALIIVAVAVWRAPINWGAAGGQIRSANVWLYLLAMAAFYASFVARAVRWRLLLENAGDRRPARGLISIIVTSFFVNCVVPAKMGDVYRAYLVKQREGVGGTRALGTIIAERLVDLVVLMVLLLIAGALTFGDRVPRTLVPEFIAGTVICLLGLGFVVALSMGRGQRILVRLPERAVERYEHFRTGAVDALGGHLPAIIGLTVVVWGLETTRFGLVVFSLHFGSLLGPAQFLFVALVAALLTTVPALPGGLGLVEFGMIGVLEIVKVGPNQSVSIALLDRSISYGSLVVIGFVVFVFTINHRRRPQRTVEEVATST
jgi:uncharacterized protein (TIRG00374 family)